MNITEKICNIIYRIQFETYTKQQGPDRSSRIYNLRTLIPGVDKQINISVDKTNYSNHHSYL